MVTPRRCPSVSCSLPVVHVYCGISDVDHGTLDANHDAADADCGDKSGHQPFIHCNVSRTGSAPGTVRLLNSCLKARGGSSFVKICVSPAIKSPFSPAMYFSLVQQKAAVKNLAISKALLTSH